MEIFSHEVSFDSYFRGEMGNGSTYMQITVTHGKGKIEGGLKFHEGQSASVKRETLKV